jgi:hypothetical protein
MTKTRSSQLWFAVPLALVATLAPAAALAKGDAPNTRPTIAPVQPLSLADNVVVTPGTQQQPAAPVVVPQNPQPGPVVVTPAPAAAPAPAEAPRRTNTIVEREQRSYVGTVFVSALLGGFAGALIGGALWYLADDQEHPARIGYWAAGGVLVGTAVGVTQILVQESRVERATAFARDPAPTYRLSLARIRF